MKGKNLVTKALNSFTKAKSLLEKAITADAKKITELEVKVAEIATEKQSHEENKTYATKMLSKIDAFLD